MKRIPLFFTFLIVAGVIHGRDRSNKDSVSVYRYDAFKKLIKQYRRPFTMLELWAGKGDVSFAVAKKYKAVCIMHEPKNGQELFERCESHSELTNLVLLARELTVNDVARLGECEHFDVTVVQDITKQFASGWKEAIDALLTLGDHLIIQTPAADSPLKNEVEAYLFGKGGTKLAQAPAHLKNRVGDVYHFERTKKYLVRRRWDYAKAQKIGEYTIKSSFTEKTLIKEKERPKGLSITTWHPGMNLLTFKKLNGIYPTKEMIRDMIKPMATIQHNDLRIFNIIMQGKNLVPIDVNENGRHQTAEGMLPSLLNHFRRQIIRYEESSSDIEVTE